MCQLAGRDHWPWQLERPVYSVAELPGLLGGS